NFKVSSGRIPPRNLSASPRTRNSTTPHSRRSHDLRRPAARGGGFPGCERPGLPLRGPPAPPYQVRPTVLSPSTTSPYRDTVDLVKQVDQAFGPDRLVGGRGPPVATRAQAGRPSPPPSGPAPPLVSRARNSRPRAGGARSGAGTPIVKSNLLILGASYGSLFSTKAL